MSDLARESPPLLPPSLGDRGPAGAPAAADPGAAASGDISPILVAASLGILVGLAEVAQILIRKELTGAFTERPAQFPWMTPITYLLLFALPAAVIALAGRWWRRLPVIGLVVFGCAAATAAAILTMQFGARLHPVSLALLSSGIGVRLAQLAAERGNAVSRRARAAFPWLASAVAVLAMVTTVQVKADAGRPSVAAASDTAAPNVLLLILDTVRAASLGLYGHPRPTSPTIDRLGREGTVFDRAFSTAPWTLPSHASLFTGRWPHEQSTGWTSPLDRADSTLAETFAARGYVTGGFVGNSNFASAETGLARGFQTYHDYSLSPGTFIRSASLSRRLTDSWRLRKLVGTDQLLGRRAAARVNEEFLAWERTRGGRPWFAFLNYFDAHDPYLPPADWFERVAGYRRQDNLSPLRRVPTGARREGMRPEAIRLEEDSYDASIAWLDSEIDGLLRELERRGALRNTIVAVTSDHGEEFGEHGFFLHGHTLFRRAVQVPLVIWSPARIPAGRRISRPVSLRDIPSTLLSLATGDVASFPGAPLTRFWEDSASHADSPVLVEVQQAIRIPAFYPASRGSLRGIIDSAFHFIQGPDAASLFAWDADSIERIDLAASPEWSALVAEYRERLNSLGVSRSRWDGGRREP